MPKNEQINIRCSKETKKRFKQLQKNVNHLDITALMIFEQGLTSYEDKFLNKYEELNHLKECLEIKEKEFKQLKKQVALTELEIEMEQSKYEIDFEDENIRNAYQELEKEYEIFANERRSKGTWHDVNLFIEFRPSSFENALIKYDLQKNHKAFTDGFKEWIENK